MPGENGLELAARLKALRPRVAVVMFSAMDVEAEARASGNVDRFVRKGDLRLLRRELDEVQEERRSTARRAGADHRVDGSPVIMPLVR